MASDYMELEQESSEAEPTPEVRLSQVAFLLSAASLRMRPTPPSISGNLSAPSNTCLDVVFESLLNVTRGECSHERQLTRGI